MFVKDNLDVLPWTVDSDQAVAGLLLLPGDQEWCPPLGPNWPLLWHGYIEIWH